MTNLIKLKDGTYIPEAIAKVLSISLKGLMQNNPIAFYEFVTKCRNSDHEMFGNTPEVLQSLSLIEQDGQIRNEVKKFVLNSVEGENLEMRLVNPVKQEQDKTQGGGDL